VTSTAPMAPTAQERLRSAGLRATSARTAVLGVLDAAGARREHLPVSEVAGRARTIVGALSLQAVYDCLEVLTNAGLARRIEPAGHPSRYESRVGDNHHHLVCRDCDATYDVDCVVGSAPCLTHTPVGDFVVDEAEVIFWGRCPDCAARINPPHPAHPNTTDQQPH
jgi:Fur family transcriptional regulator, stress-responsive regulator